MKSCIAAAPSRLIALLLAMLLLSGCGMPFRATPGQTALPHDQYVLPARTCGDFFLVDAFINERGPYTLLVDTGAQMTVLSTPAGEELDAQPLIWSRGKARGADGRTVPVLERLSIRSMRIGDLELRDFDAIVLDLEHLSPALGASVDGLLGFGSFSDLLLTLDYPGRQIRLAKGRLGDIDNQLVHESREKNRPVLKLSIGDHEEDVLLDSGANAAVSLQDVDDLPFLVALRPISSAAAVAGNYVQEAGRLAVDARFGPVILRLPIVGRTSGGPKVGTDVLKHFVLTFDQSQSRIRLEPARDRSIEFRGVYGIGAGFERRDDRWIVMDVFQGAPAEASGLRKGDAILTINGRPVNSIGCERWERLDAEPQPIDLQIEREGQLLEVEVEVVALVP